MDKVTLKIKTLNLIDRYPQYAEDFMDYYQLAMDEIEEGGSEDHECEMAFNSMQEILANNPYDN